MKHILDTFMLKMNKSLLIIANNNIDNKQLDNKTIVNENIYLICSKYIISIVELFYDEIKLCKELFNL